MRSYFPFTYIVLNTLYTEGSGTKDFILKRSEIWVDQLENIIRNKNFSQLFSEYDNSDLVSNIDHAIDSALRDHLFFVASDDTVPFIESFLKLCGIEFIEATLENDFISMTPLGVSHITQIHKDLDVERFRLYKRFGSQHCPFKPARWNLMHYSFAYKFQEGINKSHQWKDQTEYIISENEAGLKRGLDDNANCYRQCGEIFFINNWATQWWDIHHKGMAVPVCSCSMQ
jgi:hypothetical protein